MRPIVYLASYPRSGNTFLRALLANYDSDLDRPLTAQEIAHYGFGEHDEALLQRCTGLSAQERAIEDQWNARAAYFAEALTLPGEGPVMLKTHTLNGSVFGLPAFTFQPGDGIVYIVRHPLDVAVSGAHFFDIDQTHMAARMLLPGATNHSGGAYYEVTGSWVENVAGWLNETRAPIHLIRFEALCANPANELARLLKFLGRPVLHERLHRAARRTSFQGLKASQESAGFYQGPGRDPRATFFRAGKAGQWKRALNGNVAAHLSDELGELMRVLDYERAAGFGGRRRSEA